MKIPATKQIRHWTDEEIKIISENRNKLTAAQLALLIGRSVGAIRNKRVELGLKFDKQVHIGDIFGQLKVIGFSKPKLRTTGKTVRYAICHCSCGNVKEIIPGSLKSQATISCGCYRKSKSRMEPGESTYNHLESRYKFHAKKRKIGYFLSREEFRSLIKMSRHYCGSPPKPFNYHFNKGGGRTTSTTSAEWASGQTVLVTGIDRLDSNKDIGYTLSNCVPCCGDCNEMKNDKSVEDFIEHIGKILNFSKEILNE